MGVGLKENEVFKMKNCKMKATVKSLRHEKVNIKDTILKTKILVTTEEVLYFG